MTCQHEWAFSTPGHIRCTKCPAIGQRPLDPPMRRELAELHSGKWLHIGRRYAKAS